MAAWTLDESDENGARVMRFAGKRIVVLLTVQQELARRAGTREVMREALERALRQQGATKAPPFSDVDLDELRAALGGTAFG